MPIGEDGLAGYAREQIETARLDPRLGRGRGAAIADFGDTLEEVERTRMLSIIGLQEIREAYEREKADLDASGGDQQRQDDVQVFWQRAEMARIETENDYQAINAQALIATNSALDALIEHLAPAVRDMPFEMRIKEFEEAVPRAADQLSEEKRRQLIAKMQELSKLGKLPVLEGSGVARYERRMRGAGLGAPKERPIPTDLNHALTELGVIRNCLIHHAGRIDTKALQRAPSLEAKYTDGQLIQLAGDDYRTYSAAIRCYAAEIVYRLWNKVPDLIDPEQVPDLANWRDWHAFGA